MAQSRVHSLFVAQRSQGLTDAILVEAILRGEHERDSATPFDPWTRAGYDAWAEAVRALREALVPLGWRAEERDGLSLVVSPCRRHAIVVVAGDMFTGQPDHHPQPKHPRGQAFVEAVERSQLSLFNRTSSVPSDGTGLLLWFLMAHRDRDNESVRIELSLPRAVTDSGRVTSWRFRHLLPEISLRKNVPVSQEHEEVIDVRVERKK